MKPDDILKKYSETTVVFSGYYKYVFYYKNNNGLVVSVGGFADDIYKLNVDTDPVKIKDLPVSALYLNGNLIYSDGGY